MCRKRTECCWANPPDSGGIAKAEKNPTTRVDHCGRVQHGRAVWNASFSFANGKYPAIDAWGFPGSQTSVASDKFDNIVALVANVERDDVELGILCSAVFWLGYLSGVQWGRRIQIKCQMFTRDGNTNLIAMAGEYRALHFIAVIETFKSKMLRMLG